MLEHDFTDFTALVPNHTLARFCAHYELFRMAQRVPGCIVDIGVGHGGSAFAWAKMSHLWTREAGLKLVYGFDTFAGFPHVHTKDGSKVKVGDYNCGQSALEHGRGKVNAGLPLHFVVGDITQTVPRWAAHPQPPRIALLNLDADLYEPIKVALEHLMPLMALGGVVVLDNYDTPKFPGEKLAVNEYFAENGRRPDLHRFPWYDNPSAYFIVEGA